MTHTFIDAEAFEDTPEEAGVETDYLPGNILKNIEIPVKADAPQPANPQQLIFEVKTLNIFSSLFTSTLLI